MKIVYKIQKMKSGLVRVLKKDKLVGTFPTIQDAREFIKVNNAMDQMYYNSPYLNKNKKMELIFGK